MFFIAGSASQSDLFLEQADLEANSGSNTNRVMEEIAEKLKEIKDGKDTSTTVTQFLGRCLRTAAKKAQSDIFHRLLLMEGLEVKYPVQNAWGSEA